MYTPEKFLTFSENQLFAADEQATPAKSSISETTPQWVPREGPSPQALPSHANMNANTEVQKEDSPWPLSSMPQHEAHTPDLLGKSDIFGPLPTMDLPELQRSESPVPSSKRSSRRSSLLSTADEEVAASQPSSSKLAAPITPTCHDPSKAGAMHAKHSSDLAQAATQQTIQPASETGTAAPAEQQQASTRSMQETPVLLETPEGISKALSGSCQPLSAPLHFSETVVRGAAVVQSSLCQQTPLLTLQDGVAADKQDIKSPLADNVCKSSHNLTDTSADAIRPISGGAPCGTADQRQDSTTMAGISKGLPTVENERTAEVDAATSENRQTALSRLKSVTRKSVSRGPSFLSQPSRNNVLDKGRARKQQRPASSPAATKLDFDPPGSQARSERHRNDSASYRGRSKTPHGAVPISPRPSKQRLRAPAPTSRSTEDLQLQYLDLKSQVSTLHVGPDSRSQLRAAANREAELSAQVDDLRSKVKEEIDRRHEVQAKLAEQRKEAERDRKALKEELEGKLRAVRKEIADLKSLSKAPMTPQEKVKQNDMDTVLLTNDELDDIRRQIDDQERLIMGYQVAMQCADVKCKDMQQELAASEAQIAHLEQCLKQAQAQKSRPDPEAPEAAQNLAAALALQEQLQEAKKLAADKEREFAAEVARLRNACADLDGRLLAAEDARLQAEERAKDAEVELSSVRELQAQTDQQGEGALVSQRAKQIADTQRLLTWGETESLEKEVAAAHQRVQELEASLAETMRDLKRKEDAIEEYSRAEEARKQQAAALRLSASVGQKENRGSGLQPKVKELEKQLNDQRVTSARRESLLKAQLKEAKQQLQEAPTRTGTARLPRAPSAAQPQRLKDTNARLEAELAASRTRIEQLEEQLSAQQTLEEEHATVQEALEGAKSGIKKLTSRCTNLEAELAKVAQEAQVVATEKKRLSTELAASMQRAVAAEMAHRLLLHDRDRAIEERAAHHQVQLDAARVEAAREAAAAEARAWAERIAAAEAAAARERTDNRRLQAELRAACSGVPWTPKASKFEAIQQKIRTYQANEEARISQAVKAAEEAHKLEIAAKETQVVQFRQELNVIVEELEAMKRVKG
ncbi:g10131 [Coccomyxa elongata]